MKNQNSIQLPQYYPTINTPSFSRLTQACSKSWTKRLQRDSITPLKRRSSRKCPLKRKILRQLCLPVDEFSAFLDQNFDFIRRDYRQHPFFAPELHLTLILRPSKKKGYWRLLPCGECRQWKISHKPSQCRKKFQNHQITSMKELPPPTEQSGVL